MSVFFEGLLELTHNNTMPNGTPFLRGTKVPIAHVFAELADGQSSLSDVAKSLGVGEGQLTDLFFDLAASVDSFGAWRVGRVVRFDGKKGCSIRKKGGKWIVWRWEGSKSKGGEVFEALEAAMEEGNLFWED